MKTNKRKKNSQKSKQKGRTEIQIKKKPIKKHKWREVKTKKVILAVEETNDPPEDKVAASSFSDGTDNLNTQTVVASNSKISKAKIKLKIAAPKAELEIGKKESLRDRMLKRLNVARFRQINEELDSSVDSVNPQQAFDSNPELFKSYHEAYKKQMEAWPKNPLDIIVRWVKKKIPKDKVIADFGCGEASLALQVPNKVHSFDLFALNDRVTACDMSNVPLESESVDAAVFCLSLMGTDVGKFIAEASRVLKINGLLKIAEVSSRFSGNILSAFLQRMKKFGFVARQKGQRSRTDSASETGDDVFLLFEFLKIRPFKNSYGKLPPVRLNPSVYKKR